MKPIEILAPAGGMDALKAAVYAGADAVYTGGSRFGARAFADNMNTDNLIKAIDFVHLHDKKLYLTTNTLLANQEFESLYEMVAPLYEHGLDACIVQDLGVMHFLHRHFPNMELHASTQMTLQSGKSGELLKPYGVTRIVPARELSIEEIKKCRRETDLELEVFVHGALCYCYSGQCLMSSVIGGRSGNRGMCAQPCRLPYMCGGKESYLLSPKDVCTLDKIPDLIEAGIDSFKIEGRMKKKEYAALTSMLYRKYVDFYEKEGREAFISQTKKEDSALFNDIRKLMDVFNRGGFCGGYLFEKEKTAVMYPKKNGHFGVPIGKIQSIGKNKIKVRLSKEIRAQDVLEIRDEAQNSIYEYTTGQGGNAGDIIESRVLPGSAVKPGQILYRRRNNHLLDEINDFPIPDILLQGKFYARKNENSSFTVSGKGVTVTCLGGVVEAASNRPVASDDIRKRLLRTGETSYSFSDVEVDIAGDLFIPMGQLNELRRQTLSEWEEAFLSKYRREAVLFTGENGVLYVDPDKSVVATVSTREQLEAVLSYRSVSAVHISLADFSDFEEIEAKVREKGKQIFISFPSVLPENWHFSTDKPVSYLINSWEMLSYLKEHHIPGDYYLDANMYVANDEAWKCYHEDYGICDFTAALDESLTPLTYGMNIVYGKIPVMVTKGCAKRTLGTCDASDSILTIQNPKGDSFLVVSHCNYCYNTIYTSVPKREHGTFDKIRFVFTTEDSEQVRKVLREWNV